jgi:protein TonB
MTALALHQHPDRWEIGRYGAAAIAIVLLHLALIAAALFWYHRPQPSSVSLPAILVDLAPAPAAPEIQTEDQGNRPVTQEAEAPPPEPPKTEMIEQLPPTPLQEKPVVAAPPKVEPKPQPTPAKPQPVKDVKKPVKKRQAEESRASKADRIGPQTPEVGSGASAAASAANYRGILVAHLRRFKGWPAGAEARGENGVANVSFTLTRNGNVTGARLARSTGYASLDQEALAWVRRAQPMPPFPPEMREATMTFTAPLTWERRR